MRRLARRTAGPGPGDRGQFDIFSGGTKPPAERKGNVIVLPGIMGSELTATDRSGVADNIWLSILRIMAGRIERLRLADDGLTGFDPLYHVQASGILKRYYGELLLTLAAQWNVRAYWFDWRKDLDLAADELAVKANAWFGPDTPFHIVAHSMGGLVARTFIKRHTARWKSMWDGRSNHKGTEGGRLVMLGTPNHGSYLIPQVITGLSSTIRKIERVDVWHDLASILQVVNSFVGSFQMLPSPLEDKEAEPLYRTETYGDLKIPQRVLDIAWRHHELLREVIDPDRLAYVAGANQATISGIKKDSIKKDNGLRKPEAYTATFQGDGSVTHKLGLLKEAALSTRILVLFYEAVSREVFVLSVVDGLLVGRLLRPALISE